MTLIVARYQLLQPILAATLLWTSFCHAQDNIDTPLPLPLEEVRLFTEALERIRASYVEEVDDKTLLENAIRGMLSGLDPHRPMSLKMNLMLYKKRPQENSEVWELR